MNEPDFDRARDYALHRLETELGPELTYHSPGHTRDEVVPAAERLAAMEGIRGEELLLLRTAAFYHDIGYTEQLVEHEAASVRILSAVLPRFGYQPEQVEAIATLVMATHLPQSASHILEQIMADADLDVLGTDQFFSRNRDLRRELEMCGVRRTDEEWYRTQLKFMDAHHYFTASANALRAEKKRQNRAEVERLLSQVEHAGAA